MSIQYALTLIPDFPKSPAYTGAVLLLEAKETSLIMSSGPTYLAGISSFSNQECLGHTEITAK